MLSLCWGMAGGGDPYVKMLFIKTLLLPLLCQRQMICYSFKVISRGRKKKPQQFVNTIRFPATLLNLAGIFGIDFPSSQLNYINPVDMSLFR